MKIIYLLFFFIILTFPFNLNSSPLGLSVYKELPQIFDYMCKPTIFITNGSVCNNIQEWIGDSKPATRDCILDRMKAYKLNHCYFILNNTTGKWDSVINSPLNKNLVIDWNQDLWDGLEMIVEYACGLDILVTIHSFSECILEPGLTRWDQNLWNQTNGGPVSGSGENFFRCRKPDGKSADWTWQMWNAYYQKEYNKKLIEHFDPYPNVIFNPCWEIDGTGMSGYNWFKATVNYLKNNFTIHHLISVTPCTPSAFNSLPDIDFIMIENRGIPAEFRAFGKPVVCAGPSASKPVDEPEFMRTAFIRGFHPSTNLRAECSSITSGYNYALVLQAFIESVKTWYDEPGNEITRDTVPPTYNCNYPFSSPPRID